MVIWRRISNILIVLFILTSCGKEGKTQGIGPGDEGEYNFFIVSADSFFDATGGTGRIVISSGCRTIFAYADNDWLFPTVFDSTIHFRVNPNYDKLERKGNIVIECDNESLSSSVIQYVHSKSIVPETVVVDCNGGEELIIIDSQFSYTLRTTDDWYEYMYVDQGLLFDVGENYLFQERTGIVYLDFEDGTDSRLFIHQKGQTKEYYTIEGDWKMSFYDFDMVERNQMDVVVEKEEGDQQYKIIGLEFPLTIQWDGLYMKIEPGTIYTKDNYNLISALVSSRTRAYSSNSGGLVGMIQPDETGKVSQVRFIDDGTWKNEIADGLIFGVMNHYDQNLEIVGIEKVCIDIELTKVYN